MHRIWVDFLFICWLAIICHSLLAHTLGGFLETDLPFNLLSLTISNMYGMCPGSGVDTLFAQSIFQFATSNLNYNNFILPLTILLDHSMSHFELKLTYHKETPTNIKFRREDKTRCGRRLIFILYKYISFIYSLDR